MKSAKLESRISRWLKAPIRALIRARDFYVRSMNSCAGHVNYGGAFSCPTPIASTLPKSFSVKSTTSEEDFRELVRIASIRTLGDKIDLDILRRQQSTGAAEVVPRSRSVGIGRIDEDRSCDFGDDDTKYVRPADLFPRSRSYAVAKKKR